LSCGRRFRPGAAVPIESELARHAAGHVPPPTLSCLRWIGTFPILLPFASPHLKRDWPVLRAHLPKMVFLSSHRAGPRQRPD
jgi:hypothetical protein